MKVRLWILLSIIAVGVSWVYMHRVLLPWEHSVNVQFVHLRAQMEDLYPRWAGTRALLLEGKNPYGPEVTHEIQMSFYGHDVQQDYRPGVPTIDEQRFAYPIYVVFLLAPTVHMQFETLQAMAPAFLAVTVVGSAFLWMSVLRWQRPLIITAALILFLLASPQIVQGLRLRQLGLLVAFLIALGTWLVVKGHLVSAGAIFAIATIKPQMVALPLAWFLFWVIGDFRARWRLLASFFVCITLLAGAGEWLLPGWPIDFLRGMAAYRKYGPVKTLMQLVLGHWLGTLLGVLIVVSVLFYGWMNRKVDAGSSEFLQVLCTFLISALVAMPLMAQFNQALMIPAVVLLVRDWEKLPKVARIVFFAFVSWPWVIALALMAVGLHLDPLNHLPLLPSTLVLFFPFLLPVLLITRRSDVSMLARNGFAHS